MKSQSSARYVFLLLFVVAFLTANIAHADGLDGAQLYMDNCAACHKPDGTGLAGYYPALLGQPLVSGDQDLLIKALVLGPANVLPADRPKYAGVMPPIKLRDAQMEALLTYIRDKFGKGAAPITEGEVAKVKDSVSK